MKQSLRYSLLLLGLWLPLQLQAHGVTTEQIKKLSEQIQREPQNPHLYLRRGELYRLSGNAKAALEDYERVETLAPQMIEVDFLRARLYFDAKTPEMTQFALDRFLKQQPKHTEALLLRAKAHALLNEKRAAIQDYSQAIALLAHPTPDDYLARAELQMTAQRPDEALRGLEESQAKLGSLLVLQQRALEIEITLKRWDAAIVRLDALSASAPRQEMWLVQRGEILRQAGRKAEARQAFIAAQAAIAALPEPLRKTKAMTALEAKASTLLSQTRQD